MDIPARDAAGCSGPNRRGSAPNDTGWTSRSGRRRRRKASSDRVARHQALCATRRRTCRRTRRCPQEQTGGSDDGRILLTNNMNREPVDAHHHAPAARRCRRRRRPQNPSAQADCPVGAADPGHRRRSTPRWRRTHRGSAGERNEPTTPRARRGAPRTRPHCWCRCRGPNSDIGARISDLSSRALAR